jgi:hypothetical protein
VAAVDATTGTATSWDPNADNEVDALAVSGSTVYLGGSFGSINGSLARNHVAAVDATTGTATSWDPNTNDIGNGSTDAVAALAPDGGGGIVIGGAFSTLSLGAQEGVASFSVAPANTAAPVLSGTPAVGQLLSCSPGTWTGSPPVYAYQWLRDGSPIAAATSAGYTIASADQGHQFSCQVSAGNLAGSAQATSSSVAIPPDTSAPSITITTPANGATYTQGQVVDASYACTDPDGASDVASCSGPVASGARIDTSTTGSHSFTVTSADQVGNSASQTVTYTVAASTKPGTPTPKVTTSGRVFAKALGATVLVHPGIKVSCPAGSSPCTVDLTATVTVPATAARTKKTKRIVIGRANFTIPAGQSRDLTFKLNRAGAKLLRKLGHLRVTVTILSRVDHNKPITNTKTITIKAPPRNRHR